MCGFRPRVPRGAAVALIRPHEIKLQPGPGPGRVESQHLVGPMRRTVVALNDQVFDVLVTEGAWTPAPGQTFNLDLSRARIYPSEQSTVNEMSAIGRLGLPRPDR